MLHFHRQLVPAIFLISLLASPFAPLPDNLGSPHTFHLQINFSWRVEQPFAAPVLSIRKGQDDDVILPFLAINWYRDRSQRT